MSTSKHTCHILICEENFHFINLFVSEDKRIFIIYFMKNGESFNQIIKCNSSQKKIVEYWLSDDKKKVFIITENYQFSNTICKYFISDKGILVALHDALPKTTLPETTYSYIKVPNDILIKSISLHGSSKL